jgi:predicted transcriptional regulator
MGIDRYTHSDTIETLQFLVGSEVRIRLLATLNDSRADARTLVDELDVPHSTVQRNLNKLEDRGWIDATVNRRYYTTPVGEMVLDSLDGLLGTVQSMDGLAAFVDCVPFDQFEFDLDRLAEADCVVADADTPAAPLNEFVELLANSTGFTLVTPHWNPAYSDIIERQLAEGNDVTLITAESQRSLLTGSGIASIEGALDDENLSVTFAEETLPFGLAIVDQQVGLVGYRDGALRVLVESADPAIATWTDQFLDDIEATAKPVRKKIQ